MPELPKAQENDEAPTESETRPGMLQIKQNTEVEKGSRASSKR